MEHDQNNNDFQDNNQNEEEEKHENNMLDEAAEKEDEEANDEQNEERELMYIYEWVDSIQLSRPKKNMARDFNDAVLLAEIIKHYLPKLVDLHNYPNASSTKQKKDNWNTLNKKVLSKIGIKLSLLEIEDIWANKLFAIERVLQRVYEAISNESGKSCWGENDNREMGNNNMECQGASKQVDWLTRILSEKQNNIQQWRDIVEILEMKLRNSSEMQSTWQSKINDLTEIIRSKGINI